MVPIKLLVFWELRKILNNLMKAKDEYTIILEKIRPTERIHFNEPILNATKLGFLEYQYST